MVLKLRDIIVAIIELMLVYIFWTILAFIEDYFFPLRQTFFIIRIAMILTIAYIMYILLKKLV